MITLPALLLWPAFAATFFAIVLYISCTWYYNYWNKKGVPNFAPKFPFGNFKEVIMQEQSTMEFFTKMYNDFDGVPFAGYISIREPTFLVRDPELTKKILVKDFSHFHDRGVFIDHENDPLSANLVNLSGEKWNFLRNKLSPTFTSGKMRYMFPLVKKCSEDFQKAISTEVLKNGNEIEVKEISACYTTDVIGSTAFGVDAGSLENPDSDIRVAGRKIFDLSKFRAFKNFMFFLVPSLTKIFKVKLVEPDVERFFIGLVNETIEYRESNKLERNDFLQLLINLKSQNFLEKNDEGSTSNEELNSKLLCAQAFVFFIAGYETSATTLTFCLYELAHNLDIQHQVAEEIHSVLERHNGEMTYESLSEMHLMERVILETLRLHPALPVLFRVCTKDYRINRNEYPYPSMPKDMKEDLIIEKGTKVIIPVCGTHMDPKYYPDPEKFDPGRFSEEAKAQRPPCTHLPFGEGPRICMGLRFGIMQTKAGLVSLLTHFEIRPGPKTKTALVFDPKAFVPTVKDGIFLQFFPVKKEM